MVLQLQGWSLVLQFQVVGVVLVWHLSQGCLRLQIQGWSLVLQCQFQGWSQVPPMLVEGVA